MGRFRSVRSSRRSTAATESVSLPYAKRGLITCASYARDHDKQKGRGFHPEFIRGPLEPESEERLYRKADLTKATAMKAICRIPKGILSSITVYLWGRLYLLLIRGMTHTHPSKPSPCSIIGPKTLIPVTGMKIKNSIIIQHQLLRSRNISPACENLKSFVSNPCWLARKRCVSYINCNTFVTW
jgi:hypothetical protein